MLLAGYKYKRKGRLHNALFLVASPRNHWREPKGTRKSLEGPLRDSPRRAGRAPAGGSRPGKRAAPRRAGRAPAGGSRPGGDPSCVLFERLVCVSAADARSLSRVGRLEFGSRLVHVSVVGAARR